MVLAVGCRLVCETHPRDEPWLPSGDVIAHVNADVDNLDELYSSDRSCAGDPAAFLRAALREPTAATTAPESLTARRTWIDDVRSAFLAPVSARTSIRRRLATTRSNTDGWSTSR